MALGHRVQTLSAPQNTPSVIDSRQHDALRSMPACIAHMVESQAQLASGSSSKQTFQILDVMDGGGFATLLRGKLQFGSPAKRQQIAAAKVAVDMVSDENGRLTDQQRRGYQASMRHEHHIYERLHATQGSSQGMCGDGQGRRMQRRDSRCPDPTSLGQRQQQREGQQYTGIQGSGSSSGGRDSIAAGSSGSSASASLLAAGRSGV